MEHASDESHVPVTSVAWTRPMGAYPRRRGGAYGVRMRDGSDGGAANEWARYLREITSRPGWSVARLARDSGVHRSTIFRWLDGTDIKTVTVRSVRLIAEAAEDDIDRALRAAGSVLQHDDETNDLDLEVEMIQNSDLLEDIKDAMIREAYRLRDRQAAERRALEERQAAEREQIKTWIELAGGAQPAT